MAQEIKSRAVTGKSKTSGAKVAVKAAKSIKTKSNAPSKLEATANLKLKGSTRKIKAPPVDLHIEEYERLQGMLMYSLMALKATVVPYSNEIAEIERLVASFSPQKAVEELAERQKSAIKFPTLIESFGKELFGSAKFEGEKKLAENDLFTLNHIPLKKGVEKRAVMFHIGGFVPYSDNLFRLLPRANFFDHFIENGIEVYEMKLKSSTTTHNAHLLELSIEKIIDTVHAFSDIAFAHCGQKMILEGYCGTGINTFTSYLADLEAMAKKFNLLLTFVSPLDARKCTLFEQMFQILNYLNPAATSLDGHIVSSSLDIIQNKNFEKTPMGALVHGWKNKEWANVENMIDLTLRQQSELAAWYWLSVKHGGYYPLSRDLYIFYTRLFMQGVGTDGALPYEYKGKTLNLNDLKKTGIQVLAFLGGNDHLVNFQTADILKPMLGAQCEIVVHEKTGHVAYIFNPNRWNKDDGRAFKPDIVETILSKLQVQAKPINKPVSLSPEPSPVSGQAGIKGKATSAATAAKKPVAVPKAVTKAKPVKTTTKTVTEKAPAKTKAVAKPAKKVDAPASATKKTATKTAAENTVAVPEPVTKAKPVKTTTKTVMVTEKVPAKTKAVAKPVKKADAPANATKKPAAKVVAVKKPASVKRAGSK
ncbi:MAG: hypothetical protein H6R18_2262 [Proteobacteria bacterium]|nr:hypothetical protein [Pseudomonadota bacterium]